MKKLFTFALILCSPAAHAVAQATPAPAAATPDPPPKVMVTRAEPLRVVPEEIFSARLQDLDGGVFSLSDYRGRVFVINIWATWCGPCRLEIPQLNKLYEEYSARGVEFVGLTTERPGEDDEKVRQFAREFEMKYKLGWAERDVALGLMRGTAIPQTLVVAADGRVVISFRGYSPQVPQILRDGIEKALKLPPDAQPPARQPPAPAGQTPPAAPAPAKPVAPETLPAPGA